MNYINKAGDIIIIIIPQGCNQQNPGCGKLYTTDDPVSSTKNFKRENDREPIVQKRLERNNNQV